MGTPFIEAWIMEGPLASGAAGGLPFKMEVKEGAGAFITIPCKTTGGLVGDTLSNFVAYWSARLVTAIGAGVSMTLVPASNIVRFTNNTTFSIRLSESLRRALGFLNLQTDRTGAGNIDSDTTPQGFFAPWGITLEAPKPIEVTQLREMRHGRAVSIANYYGSAQRMSVHVDSSKVDTLLAGPLLAGGKIRVHPDGYTATAYGPGGLTGVGSLTGYRDLMPLNVVEIRRFGMNDSQASIVIDCATEE